MSYVSEKADGLVKKPESDILSPSTKLTQSLTRGLMRISALILSIILASSTAYASDTSCQSDLKECFMLEGAKKNNCLYRIAENSECASTEAGKLAAKRSGLAADTEDESENSFLGPSSINNSCLISCDNQWLAFIVADETPANTAKHVSACLDGCKNSNQELMTP